MICKNCGHSEIVHIEFKMPDFGCYQCDSANLPRCSCRKFEPEKSPIDAPTEHGPYSASTGNSLAPTSGEIGALVKQEKMEKPECLKIVFCPQCGKEFKLKWRDWDNMPRTLIIRDCPSGGIYNVAISCPHCDYEEEL